MITVKEFKNIFDKYSETEIMFFKNKNENNDSDGVIALDLLSFELKPNNFKENIVYHYILKEVPETSILNSINSINDIFINGKNEYDLIDFSFVNDHGEEVNIIINDIIKFVDPSFKNYIDIQFKEI